MYMLIDMLNMRTSVQRVYNAIPATEIYLYFFRGMCARGFWNRRFILIKVPVQFCTVFVKLNYFDDTINMPPIALPMCRHRRCLRHPTKIRS